MVLYELLSNVASTDQGLREQPACLDLVQTFQAAGVNLRFLRQVHRETDEINLASGQYSKGVRVRGVAQKNLRPETHIKGCLAWARAVVGRIDRGLHLEVTQIRSTNAAPLAMGVLLRKGHHVFLSGVDAEQLRRLRAVPDPTLTEVPAAIKESESLYKEYMSRRDRTGGFLTQVQDVAALEVLAPEAQERLRAVARERDQGVLAGMGEAEIVNIGLLSEYVERYRSLCEQYAAQFGQGELTADLFAQFDLLLQGVPYVEVRVALEPFTNEATRDRITDKRTLVNELRIALGKGTEAERESFATRLRSLVVKQRLRQDPGLYDQAVLLPSPSVEVAEARAPFRERTAGFRKQYRAVRDQVEQPAQPATAAMKQHLFELLLQLTFDAQFASKLDVQRLPGSALAARGLLDRVRLARFNLTNLRRISPKLPVRGVARNLVEKVPVTWGEIDAVLATLQEQLFPLGELAETIERTIRERLKAEAEQRRMDALRQYLNYGHVLLGLTNYVLGRARLADDEWGALLEGGRTLGLPMLESRDQIRSDKALRQVQEGLSSHPEGYVLLLNREEQTLFPLKAQPVLLARALRDLAEKQLVRVVRRFFFQRLQVLVKRHGAGLFEVLYRHVGSQQIRCSRHQFADVLLRHGVFEKTRLRELGYQREEIANGDVGENGWLVGEELATGEPADHPLASDRVATVYRQALDAFRQQVSGYPEPPESRDEAAPTALPEALALLNRDGIHDLGDPRATEALAATDAAALLWKTVQQAVSQHFKTILGAALSAQEAILLTLPGRLAPLCLLKPDHVFQAGEHALLFRLVPEPEAGVEGVDGGSAPIVALLEEIVSRGGELAEALSLLGTHQERWSALREVSLVPLVDQMLRETLLHFIQPAKPLARDIREYPDAAVLCLGVSSSDQAKFHKLLERVDAPNVFATLSELASWLARFPRLEEELERYRDLIDDIVAIVDSMNFTVWDAPYVPRYREQLLALREVLTLKPEHFTHERLRDLEEQARALGAMVREIHGQEQAVRPRDRWLNRIATRLRALRPESSLLFVNALYEGAERDAESTPAPEAPTNGEKRPEGNAQTSDGKEYQTFSERVRNVVDYRERLDDKEVFVLSPANTQRALTLGLIDRLFSLKGLATPLFVDVAGCESFISAVRTRLPPHRLFNLNAL